MAKRNRRRRLLATGLAAALLSAGAARAAYSAQPREDTGGRHRPEGGTAESVLTTVVAEHHYPVGIAAGQFGEMYVECPAGASALSGGFRVDGDTSNLAQFHVVESLPVDSDDGSHPIGWKVGVDNTSPVTAVLTVDVICALPSRNP